MKCLFVFLTVLSVNGFCQQLENLPLWTPSTKQTFKGDWLVKSVAIRANVYRTNDGSVILNNGLVQREFVVKPNVACVDFRNLSNDQQLLRAVKPEATIWINNIKYNVGGLEGQTEKAYFLRDWLPKMTSGKTDFVCKNITVNDRKPFVNWKPKTWKAESPLQGGKVVTFTFASPVMSLEGITVDVNYEIFDGLPLIVKWVEIRNNSLESIVINRVVNEVLGLVEEESAVVGTPEEMKKQHGIYLETNYAFNNAMRYDISDQTTHWKTDSSYTSQVNYNYQTPATLEVYPEKVTAVELKPGERFSSVRTHELLMDSYDRERRGLAIRKMYRAVAPWITQNPIFMHLVSKNDEQVFTAVDQCAQTGYEAVILSFGSHLNMEDDSKENLARWKKIADYAHNKKVLIGGYSLFSSRRISDEDDVISPETHKPGGAFFGNAPCFGSEWGLAYRDKIKKFFTETGFDVWENDGPYPGDVCASTTHPGHRDLSDSQWRQMSIQKDLYHWLNEKGVYINAPDWYFLDGTHKIALGYREVNFSLSREQQKILNRQNIFDGTWEKTPSMGWGFVPLTVYQGGGADAVLEPLDEHRRDYEQLMFQYYGSGIQACYRGPRLFDSDSTKAVVQRMITWYKRYREILNAEIIHLRRPDGRDWDGIMHVSPSLKQRGLILLFNPTKEKITRTISIPLYYTGLENEASIREREGKPVRLKLKRDFSIEYTFSLEPESYSWFVIE